MKNRWKNNIGYKILAVVFAFLLWWIVVNVDDPIDVKQYEVDVIVTNPEVVTNSGQSFQVVENTKKITVTVKARRKVLAEIKKSHIMATADLREMQGTAVPVRVSISGFDTVYEEVNAYPQNIQLKVENTIKRTFPITAMATGSTRAGYVVGTLSPEPKTVDVSGPESIIKKISKVVARVDVSEMSVDKGMKTKLLYYDAADNELDKIQLTSNCDKNGVSVYVDLWKTKEVPMKFETSALKTAKGYAVARLEVEPEKIEVYASPDMMDSITEVVVGKEALKMSGLTENEEVIVKISDYLPEGIRLADADAESVVVRIIVEKAGTKKVELATGSIKVLQLSEKLQLSYDVVTVELQISGSKDQLESIASESVEGTIDLQAYTKEGTYEVPVTVNNLPENCTVEGTVTITLKKK